jgi:hypothetical protein
MEILSTTKFRSRVIERVEKQLLNLEKNEGGDRHNVGDDIEMEKSWNS